jgi:hypothetical protein
LEGKKGRVYYFIFLVTFFSLTPKSLLFNLSVSMLLGIFIYSIYFKIYSYALNGQCNGGSICISQKTHEPSKKYLLLKKNEPSKKESLVAR